MFIINKRTIFILGDDGVGKSSVDNSLLGREDDYKNIEDGKKCFESGEKTLEVCAHEGHFLNDETYREVNISNELYIISFFWFRSELWTHQGLG